jgi:cytochrome c-type biogenesis protein CcmH/NrfG
MSTPQSRSKPAGPHRRWLAAAFVGLLGVGVAAWLWPGGKPPIPPQGDLAGVDPEVAELIEEARREVLRSPGSQPWGRLGMVFRAHDFGDESVVCFREAERLDPNDPRWPYLTGLTVVSTDPEAGIRCLERAVARTDKIEPRLRLAELLLEQGRLTEAEGHFRAVLEISPAVMRARLGMARLAFARNDWRAGLNHLEGAAKSKLVHTLRAEALQRLGAEAESAQELKTARAMADDPPWPDPFVEAVERLQVGVRARLALADSLSRRGAARQAADVLEGVVRQHPDHGQAWLLLGRTWLKASRWPLAERALAESVRAEPNGVEAWFALGVARAHQRNVPGAIKAFSEVVRLKPDHTEGHYNLGLCLTQQGDRAGAARAFRRALSARPNYEPARKALAALPAE